MTDSRKKMIIKGLISAWKKADEEHESLFIQAFPLSPYAEDRKDIPNLNFKLGEARIRAQTLIDELCSFVGIESIKYPTSDNIALEKNQGGGTVSLERPASIPSLPTAPADTSYFGETERLRQRVEKGREYLKKEYWVGHGGKGRRDPQIEKEAQLWMNLNMQLLEREKNTRS